MVLFRDRWIKRQSKEEKSNEKIQERLCVRTKASSHWLTEHVNGLTESSDTHPPQECQFEKEPEALNELESTHPKISKDLQFDEESTANVTKLMTSSDTQLRYEFSFESMSEALTNLISTHPEIFEELQFVEEARPDEQTSLPNTSLSEEF